MTRDVLPNRLSGLVFNGSPFNDFGFGSSMDDMLFGNGGNDTLRGFAGADLLDGGTGIDRMDGGEGDDTYVIRAGDGAGLTGQLDQITEQTNEGTDTVQVLGVTAADVRFSGTGAFVFVGVDDGTGTGTYLYTAIFAGSNLWDHVERIELDDGTFWDATTGLNQTGTSGDDNLLGTASGETLDGQDGNDRLTGQGGNDIIDGGAGQDLMIGGTGDDTYIIDTGDGSLMANVGTDAIQEFTGGGTDTLRIRGIAPQDLILTNFGAQGHIIGMLDAVGAVRVTLLFNTLFYDFFTLFERIEFDDGTVWDSSTGLMMRGTGAGEQISGTLSGDTIYGEGGNDSLIGGGGNDTLLGGLGDDALTGGTENDILRGGAGADYMRGDTGDDTYIIASGDGAVLTGAEIIEESASQGSDTLHFEGILATELVTTYGFVDSFGSQIAHFFFGIEDANNALLWSSARLSTSDFWDLFEAVTFDDGTTYTALTGLTQYGSDQADVMWATEAGDDLFGQAGDDELQGRDGNDRFTGGQGADFSWGRGGDDTYVLTYGDGGATFGQEILREDAAGGTDTIYLPGVSPNDIWISYSAGQFHFGIDAGAAGITYFSVQVGVGNDWSTFWSMFEAITFDDGTTWTAATSLTITGTPDDETVDSFTGGGAIFGNAGNDTLNGSINADVIVGGTGNDVMIGNEGGDAYIIGIGDGSTTIGDDRIVEFNSQSGTDILRFSDNISLADLNLSIDSNSISFGVEDAGGTILWTSVVNVNTFNGFQGLWDVIEEIHFDDGTILNSNSGFVVTGTGADETLIGTVLPDILEGNGGNDILNGAGGNDFLFGGEGDDILQDAQGFDELTGGAGADLFVFLDLFDGGRITDFEAGIDHIDLRSMVGDYDTVVLENFDTRLSTPLNPRANGNGGLVEITFLTQGSDLGISISRKEGIALGGGTSASFNISISNGLMLDQTADLFLF